MLSSDETKAGGKRERKAKPGQDGDKGKRKRKAAAQVPGVDQQSALEETGAPVAMMETAPSVAATETVTPLPSADDTIPTAPGVADESAPVSYRALADAWSNYSRTSLEQMRSYFEKLAGVRSFGAAFELQIEFAKQACETFVAESRRIGEMQAELTKQRLKRLEGFMEKMTLGALGKQ